MYMKKLFGIGYENHLDNILIHILLHSNIHDAPSFRV